MATKKPGAVSSAPVGSSKKTHRKSTSMALTTQLIHAGAREGAENDHSPTSINVHILFVATGGGASSSTDFTFSKQTTAGEIVQIAYMLKVRLFETLYCWF